MKLHCLLCNDIIESKSVHDFVKCKCGKCYIDGGKEYTRIGFEKQKDFELINDDGSIIKNKEN